LDGSIKVVKDKATETAQTFYLSATTLGQVVARQSIQVSETACAITVSNDSAYDQEIVVSYSENGVVNYAKELETELNFATGDPVNCPVN